MESLETVRIDSIATGGDGVGRLEDGRVVFVPLSAPGDVVVVRLVEQSRRLARGAIESLVQGGPARIEPRCPVYGACGGCSLQHLDPDAQLDVKRRIVEDHLVRPGWVGSDRVDAVLPSPEPWGYRARMRFHVARGEVGLYRRASRTLVPTAECAIAAPEIRAAVAALGPLARASGLTWFDLEVRATGSGAELLFLGDEIDMDALRTLGEACLGRGGIEAVSLACGPQRWSSRAEEGGEDPVGSFRQANPGGNRLLHALVLEAIPPGPEPVLELFAGSGNFSLALAASGHPVLAVESDGAAAAAGRLAAVRDGLPVRFEAAGVTRFLRTEPGWRDHELVLVNPPRTGLPARVPRTLTSGAMRRLVYVSCQPATLGRDVARFLEEGLRVERVSPVDLFPQTEHVECVAVLER